MDIFTGAGLALPAGLNAYIPLLTVALLARFTDLVTLEAPYDMLSSNWGIAILSILLVIELFADAVPGLDHVNDLIQTVIRPASGATVMLATEGQMFDMHPVLEGALGIALAGSVHAVKALGRPVVSVSTGGFVNPLVSTVENVISLVTSVIAIVAPVLIAIGIAVLAIVGIGWLVRRMTSRGTRSRGNKVDTV